MQRKHFVKWTMHSRKISAICSAYSWSRMMSQAPMWYTDKLRAPGGTCKLTNLTCLLLATNPFTNTTWNARNLTPKRDGRFLEDGWRDSFHIFRSSKVSTQLPFPAIRAFTHKKTPPYKKPPLVSPDSEMREGFSYSSLFLPLAAQRKILRIVDRNLFRNGVFKCKND